MTHKIAALALVAMLAACSSGGTGHGPVPPSTPAQAVVVTYELDGTATSANITYYTPRQPVWQRGVDVPLTNLAETTDDYAQRGRQVFGFHSGDHVYFAAEDTGESGSLTCRIHSNNGYGGIISENTSRGVPAQVTCRGRVP